MLDQGAEVVGFDLSPRMIEEAERRCSGRGRFLVADLAMPLPLEAASLDGITCSLALHYVADLTVPFRSFASALRPGGWAVISLDHPLAPPLPGQRGGYLTPSGCPIPGARLAWKSASSSGADRWEPFLARSPTLVSSWIESQNRSPPKRRCGSSRESSPASSVCRGSSFTGSGGAAIRHLANATSSPRC